MRIDELVSMDMQGDFRSDVQLSDYENPTVNRELLQNYIFTVHAPTTFSAARRSLSARDVLEQLKSIMAFKGENRIALVANYGHGKSHLALVLANFFARPADSEEVQIVLSRLGQALNNASQLAGYSDFKKSKGEFLVVRLQGDRFGDLQEGFIYALEHALSEHPSTCGVKIPLWIHPAEAWLKQLSGAMLQRAETFLAQKNMDVPSLLASLHRQGAYELVRELFKHLHNAYPDFGREINLEDLVIWAVDDVCKPKGLGGLLILFDEFSLFLQKYMATQTVGKLQELLNGVSKRRGTCAFLALSQQDVDTVAENYAQAQRRDSVKKELERLPTDKRARLYSLMESVLASYLKQNDAVWESWYTQRPVRAALSQAREIVLRHFGKRYTEDLRWDTDAVEQKLVKGCLPLHPLTAAILSAHSFESGVGETRTALHFVRTAWNDLRRQPAQLQDGRPNFVFPIALVDFFEAQLSKPWYDAYNNAAKGPQALTEDQHKMLKALFVQQAVGLGVTGGEQLDLLSHLSGLDREIVKSVLKELSNARITQFNPVSKVSSLYPASTRPQEVEELLQKAVQSIPIDHALTERIISELAPLELPLNFGNVNDWSPRQIALTATMFVAEKLTEWLQPYRYSVNGIEEGVRGLVVWLIAQSEDERLHLHTTAQSVLDEALGNSDHPLPVVVLLPRKASPGLIASVQRLKALEALSHTDREKIGSVMYNQELDLAKSNFAQAAVDEFGGKSSFAEVRRNLVEYALPSVYRHSIQASKNLSLKAVVTECYRQAYAYRVEFSDKPVGGKGVNQLRAAVQNIARWMFSDTAGDSIRNLANKDMKYQVANFYLMQKWRLLASGSHAIQSPTSLPLQQAWDLLEDTFAPGCQDVAVRSILLTLLNPPYGHDYNTLTLLLAAWIGFHQHEIRLSLSGKMVSPSRFIQCFDEFKRPQDFLTSICVLSPLAISRSKPDEAFNQANAVLDQIRQGKPFSIPEANDDLAKLEQVQTNPRLPEAKREEIEQLTPRLEEALQRAQDYDQEAGAWLQRLTSASFDELLKLRESLKALPVPLQVMPSQPALSTLQTRWETDLQTALESFCARHESLKDLADYKAHERELQRARKILTEYPASAKRVEGALDKLTQRYDELKQQESEKTIVDELDAMVPSAGLSTLYAYRERLAQLTNLSPKTSKRRDEKSGQIENRIQQYEQIARALPEAVEKATQTSELRQQRDILLRNLDRIQETPLHPILLEAKQKIEDLETFFEQVRMLEALPRRTPADLGDLETQIADIETQYSMLLSSAQMAVLEKKKQEVENRRSQERKKAQDWLTDLARRYNRNENPDDLLRLLERPPDFFSDEEQTRLETIRQAIQKRRDENVLLRIENLFKSIGDPETRRQCLKRLQELMGD